MREECYAHSKEGAPKSEWHTLRDHLEAVAKLASSFAAKWGAGKWGHYAGLWHDLGKFCDDFQKMITADAEAERSRVNHTSAGALRAMEEMGEMGLLLAFVIAGHHAGLADLVDLQKRLHPSEQLHLDAAVAGGANAEWLRMPVALTPPESLAGNPRNIELWIRFLFSALIDADRLDTECFHDQQKTALRGSGVPLRELAERVDAYIDALAAKASEERAGDVNAVRADVLFDCRARADEPQGVFTLTVPTGGGKTLASMSFALRHAVKHNLDRVIVVIPYTSIIEQNASVLKQIVGEENVLEHHTNFDPGDQRKYWLDAENWDAPIVVTTSVQFFESLFASKTSVARKVHAIARSVVVFDEVQTLPPALLIPIIDVMNELWARYGSSLVLCTATQPALQKRAGFPGGFAATREIVHDPRRHFEALQRVEARWPSDLFTPEPWSELGARIAREERALTIVHRRDDARLLCELLPGDTLHLSAAMCPQHRTEVLAEVRRRLGSNEPCRLVATQLVEAGVDLDFPVVFRALAGLDSLAQAAGRCNREGRSTRGRLEIFVAETLPPAGELRTALDAGRIVASKRGGTPDLFFDPSLYTDYFLQFYGTPMDVKGIQTDRAAFHFATVAANFQMIEDGQESIGIPFDEHCRELLERFNSGDGNPRLLRRRLQRYAVSVSRSQMNAMREAGVAVETKTGSGVFVLAEIFSTAYHARYGLVRTQRFAIDPEKLVT
ncbi:MAG: CRISPR-associated endonuclease/helicase Cas3 [Thermoanaerobaculia bacterium]|nr:CRISPR-associated endonuclease/helicase Cas3 [Thermoanaerobaculia bacterium]